MGIVGWGVGGIEAEAVLLGQPYYMLLPEVVGMKLTGVLPEGAHGIALAAGQLYAKSSTSGGFHVVDVSSPAAPALLGSTTLQPGSARIAAATGTGRA